MNHLVRIIVAAGLAVLSCNVSAVGRPNARPDFPPGVIVEKPIERDTTRAEIFSSYYTAKLLLDIYKHLTADTTDISNAVPRESRFFGNAYNYRVEIDPERHSIYSRDINEGGLMHPDNTNFDDIDNPHFPKRMARQLRKGNREYLRRYGQQMADERHGLTQYLRELSADEELPLIFADIYREYGGDIERYVNDLYDRSILTSYRRMTKFCRRPRAKTFVSDPGVRFVVSMELYRNDRKLKALQAARGSGE